MAQMHNVEPNNEELPFYELNKYMNAMPSRNPWASQPRNLTGLYLGVENNETSKVPRSHVPPLARGRGMPSRRVRTPTEERRYHLNATDEYYVGTQRCGEHCTPVYPNEYLCLCVNIPHFPPMPPSRYPLVSSQKKVEMLRLTEGRRGFSGNPVKKRTQNLPATDEVEQPVQPVNRSNTNTEFWDITRQTNRNFTMANNSGVKHLEYLHTDMDRNYQSEDIYGISQQAALVAELQKSAAEARKEASGLVHCYNKICKGKAEALQSLLTKQVSPRRAQAYKSTGFDVKSYRLPNQAELQDNFPPVSDAAWQRNMSRNNPRPLVPNPYFFKSYNPVRPGASTRDDDLPMQHSAGAGSLSRSVSRARQHPSSPRPRTPPPPRTASSRKVKQEEIFVDSAADKDTASSPNHIPHEPDSPASPQDSPDKAPAQDFVPATDPGTEGADSPAASAPQSGALQPAPDIVIGVLDEKGNLVPLTDQLPSEDNITVKQQSEIMLKSADRKEELAHLLDEHAEIIQGISDLELKNKNETENTGNSTEANNETTSTPEGVADVNEQQAGETQS